MRNNSWFVDGWSFYWVGSGSGYADEWTPGIIDEETLMYG